MFSPQAGRGRGEEESRINSRSNVRAKITHLLINGTYTQNKREMKQIFVITFISCTTQFGMKIFLS